MSCAHFVVVVVVECCGCSITTVGLTIDAAIGHCVWAMEGVNKLYVLFLFLVIFTVSLMILVYDMQGDSSTISLLHRSTSPKIRLVAQHDKDWSLAEYGFDNNRYPMSNEQHVKDTEVRAWVHGQMKSKGRTPKVRQRKKKRKRKKERQRQKFILLANGDRKSVDSGQLKKRFPNAIIIGSKKCGTRALLKQLGFHSRIATVGHEMHFFDRNFDKGFDWYREQMPLTHRDELTIEKTPAYFVSEETPERIYEMERKFSIYIKFIVIVRDPVKRAISDYAQGLYRASKRKKKKMSFERKVFSSLDGRVVNREAYFIRIGLYAKHLKRWLTFFNLSQIHFVSGERLIAKPWEELKGVQRFLNISEEITKDNFWYNNTKKFYCVKEKDVDVAPKCMGETKGRKHPDIDQATVRALREFYKPFNREFYEMVKKDFGWPER